MDIKIYLEEKRKLIDAYLKAYFSHPTLPNTLHEAIVYSLFAGGKRLRPILALASYEACGGVPKDILPQAAALELIHTYSLIHDDLPAMDDDDLRRGKPTNHKIFGEAIAILAGDALLTEAFLMMSNPPSPPFRKEGEQVIFSKGEIKRGSLQKRGQDGINTETYEPSFLLEVVRDVAYAAGLHGMVGGQAQDIISENAEPDTDVLQFIHFHKTAALIQASARMGPVLAGSTKERVDALTDYGQKIGLAFQIVDDILDIEGTIEELGKSPGADRKKKKMTYPVLYGTEGARKKANELLSAALNSLKKFSSGADPLREIARYIVVRRT